MTLNLTHFSGPSVVSILVDVPVVLITWAITIRHRLIAWIRAACHFQLMLLLAWNTLSTLLLRPNSHMDQWRNFKFWAPRKETNWALLFFVPMAKAKGACKLLCKKILIRILGPLGPWPPPPHCGVCGVTIYATESSTLYNVTLHCQPVNKAKLIGRGRSCKQDCHAQVTDYCSRCTGGIRKQTTDGMAR